MKQDLPTYQAGFSGSSGYEVFYNRKGQTFVRKNSNRFKNIPTQQQWIMRKRFADAVVFAKNVIADPALKALYNQMAGKRCSAYSMAVSEYMVTGGNGIWVL